MRKFLLHHKFIDNCAAAAQSVGVGHLELGARRWLKQLRQHRDVFAGRGSSAEFVAVGRCLQIVGVGQGSVFRHTSYLLAGALTINGGLSRMVLYTLM